VLVHPGACPPPPASFNPPCVCQLYLAHRTLRISQLRPDTAMIRLQVSQKDPGQPALITNIAKVQAPQGGRPLCLVPRS